MINCLKFYPQIKINKTDRLPILYLGTFALLHSLRNLLFSVQYLKIISPHI